TREMRFRMGTGSTLLTSAGARMLMEQGKLKLESPIQTVSVDDEDPRFRQRCEQPVDAVSEKIANAAGDSRPRFPQPCEQPVDAVSAKTATAAGQPFLTFMQQQVFQPLSMNDPAAESST